MFFQNCFSPQVRLEGDAELGIEPVVVRANHDTEPMLTTTDSSCTCLSLSCLSLSRVNHLLGSPLFQQYAVWHGLLYVLFFCLMMLVYEICAPELLEKSLDPKVYGPVVYVAVLVLTIFFFGNNRPKLRLLVKLLSGLFFVGTYYQLFYIYDNYRNFNRVFESITDFIDEISFHISTKRYWEIVGYIVLGFTVIGVLAAKRGKASALFLVPVSVVLAKFILIAIFFAMILLFPFVCYFYQTLLWITYPLLVMHDLNFILTHF